MYIPPMVDPELGLEDNQLLIENKMVLGGASGSWNATFINKVGDTLPLEYKQRYVVNTETGSKSILPVGTEVPAGYEVREMEILDLGCGKGRVAHDMMRYTGGKASGINIDVSQLKNAMRFALDRDLWPLKLNFMYGTFNNKLPFEDESLDFCYEIGAFTYLIDKLAVFKDIYRVLRPGGAFCYNDWTLLEGYNPNDAQQVADLLKIKKLSGLIELHNPKELAALAQKAGFEVIWNQHGGYNADPTSGLLSNMQGSFWFADFVMDNLIKYKILPKHLIKAWQNVRPSEGKALKKSMEEKWLDVGHIFLIRKPYK
jgi:SAM-dependent methyltransferase